MFKGCYGSWNVFGSYVFLECEDMAENSNGSPKSVMYLGLIAFRPRSVRMQQILYDRSICLFQNQNLIGLSCRTSVRTQYCFWKSLCAISVLMESCYDGQLIYEPPTPAYSIHSGVLASILWYDKTSENDQETVTDCEETTIPLPCQNLWSNVLSR